VSALQREESIGGHYRSDYPDRNIGKKEIVLSSLCKADTTISSQTVNILISVISSFVRTSCCNKREESIGGHYRSDYPDRNIGKKEIVRVKRKRQLV
jgi:aspartate oxidase